MKFFIFASMLAISISAKSQTTDSTNLKLNRSSIELAKFANLTGAGTACMLLGGGAAWVGAGKSMDTKGLIYGGAAVAGLGLILNLLALGHITKASEYLRSNGIVIPLHK
jgi:hypothetical protein